MTSFIEQITKQAQDYYKKMPVIILGSGASAAFNLSGMGALAQHLLKTIDVTAGSDAEKQSWLEFSALLAKGTDLETALHKVETSDALTQKIVQATWELLAPEDLNVFDQSLVAKDFFPLGRLLANMFRSTQTHVNIITTNYDRLAEYACEQEGLHHYSGFSFGYRRRTSSPDSCRTKRQVNVWKVHGSLDWFCSPNGEIVGTGNTRYVPTGLVPAIVTPGRDKYRNTHREPFKSIIHAADDVLDSASSYLCIGFGFNDEHIQTKLVNRCARNGASVIVITYELSEAAKRFLHDGVEDWLAIEVGTAKGKSLVHSSLFDKPEEVDGDIWSLDGFLKLIM